MNLRKQKKEFEKEGKTFLCFKVKTNAPEFAIKEILKDSTIKIDVPEIPEKGKVNNMIIKFLSSEFKVDKNKIKMISGKSSKRKLIKIEK